MDQGYNGCYYHKKQNPTGVHQTLQLLHEHELVKDFLEVQTGKKIKFCVFVLQSGPPTDTVFHFSHMI